MWGTGEYEHLVNPDMPWNEEIRAAWARMERLAASPRTVALMWPLVGEMDVRAVLPTVRVPTLVVQHADDPIVPPAKGRYVADHIPGAKYVELPGRNMYHFVEPWRESFQEIAEFLTGHQADVADDRVLATVLFTDIVDSTRRAAEIGDRDWRALLDAHDAVVRSQLARFRGREVNTSGDGFLATFDGPQRAIRCAMAIRDAVQPLGIEVRAGLHTGECEIRGDDIGGIAVHIGARVSALAGPNDVLVSSTLRDLVIGSGLEFDDRGAHELKGVPGEWHLFAVASTGRVAVFSETRYALNGDLRVAYRASPQGDRDIVFVPNWFTCCEVIPELPSIQGWLEAMTSLGRLIFFDQPGTGASDPIAPDALPTLEQWADSITAVLDDLGSSEAVLIAVAGAFAPRHCSPRPIRPAPQRSSCSRATRIRLRATADGSDARANSALPLSPCGARASTSTCVNPDMPWNEEIRAAWARMERLWRPARGPLRS